MLAINEMVRGPYKERGSGRVSKNYGLLIFKFLGRRRYHPFWTHHWKPFSKKHVFFSKKTTVTPCSFDWTSLFYKKQTFLTKLSTKNIQGKKTSSTRWWFQIICKFSPLPGEDEPILTSIFFRWVGSTTNELNILHQSQIPGSASGDQGAGNSLGERMQLGREGLDFFWGRSAKRRRWFFFFLKHIARVFLFWI